MSQKQNEEEIPQRSDQHLDVVKFREKRVQVSQEWMLSIYQIAYTCDLIPQRG